MSDNDNRKAYDTPAIDLNARGVDPRQRPEDDEHVPFVHLENFFYNVTQDPGNRELDQPSYLYRMLELVATPSLFTGANTWLNPTMFPASVATMMPGDPRTGRLPPFNSVSEYREPGRINLNTVFSTAVYAGLFQSEEEDADDVEPDGNDSVHPGPRWNGDDDCLVRSRRGYGPGDADMLSLNSDMPTLFANPLRGPDEGRYVPLPSMVRAGVETTMFRSTSARPDAIDEDPLLAADTEEDYNNAERNPFFRYAPMTRLDNLVSTRSGVYAVWITIGFFEVEDLNSLDAATRKQIAQNFDPNANDIPDVTANPLFARVYPDGYTLGKEAGLDEGNVQRLRGFYIIDRTRPAGFQPGIDNNVEKLIRLRRRIE